MEGVGSEVSLKIRSAIKAKLVELGTYVDEELPDYIMVLVANKKTKDQMDDDLSLFLGHNTERFTSWLHHVLQKLNAAALLQVTTPQPEEGKKKDTEEEKKKMKEDEKKREKDEAKKREKAEEMKKVKDEEKKKSKEKDKLEKKKKLDRKEKNLKVETNDEDVAEKAKKLKDKEGKEKVKNGGDEDEGDSTSAVVDGPQVATKKIKPLVRAKVSSADIFRAEAGDDGKEEEEDVVDDMLELRPEVDELGLELAEEDSAPKKTKSEQRKKIVAPRTSSSKDDSEVEPRLESKVKKSKHGSPATRTSAKERLGRVVPSKSDQPKDKPSVLDRLGTSSSSSRRIINLREESSFPPRSDSDSNTGMARAVSSAISSAQRSVCVLPASSSSGKKLEARVRPLMSKHIESSRDEHSREGSSRSSTSRVVSAVGAVLKRSHKEVDSDDEEYDPKKPMLGSMASKVEVLPRPRRSGAIQANTALILRAVADAHKSVNKPSRRHADKAESPKKKHKGEIYTRSYREREQAQQKELADKDLKLRKIAITVPNATRKESEKQQQEETMLMSEIGSVVTKPVEKRKAVRPVPMEDDYEIDEGYDVEEMEGLEEGEYVDPINEQLLPLSHRKVPILSGDKTKFIVTLEGLDAEGYPVRTERPDIRSRLGARPVHNDSLEEVEEYIEEVEEWEEMDDGVSDINQDMAVGDVLSDSGKPKPKSAITAPTSTEGGTKKPETERCKFWPTCKTGDACPYHHPSVACKLFPNCKFGDKCAYIHPKCAYDGACTRVGCSYTHYAGRSPSLVAATLKHKMVAPRRPAKIKCRFFPKCTNMSCPYLHPKACFYGTSCKQANCPFSHPEIPTGAKLKWIAPKTTTPKIPATTLEEKPKEVPVKE
ncbi:zinc finger CCCH domain-containing protein 14-like [Macrobrachium nipponense]|uniref:zinc finger CCCH domain-containing protein 14-like n=1 Tax=Macrobrachium nipponense TaxID=159736 RepID=UPI0030C8C742